MDGLKYNSSMVKIGSATIDTNIFLAPLAGCSDLAFRLIAREHGAGFCFFEMVDAHTLIRSHPKTLEMLKTTKDDSPIAAQLLGRDPAMMADAATKVAALADIKFVDINCACPVKKVIKKKAGAYLLEDPAALSKIIRKMVSSLPVPVTVKMRLGHLRKDTEEMLDIAKRCEADGASALFVHGRTSAERHAGEIDYGSIRLIKDSVRIPVFGMGNILTVRLAKRMFDETRCDGIVVARGAIGNPWIFGQIPDYLKSGKDPEPPDFSSRKDTLKRHLSYIDKYKDISRQGKMGFMRKVALWYLRSFRRAASIRRDICGIKNYPVLLEAIDAIE